MSEKEKLDCAKGYRNLLFSEKMFAQGRCSELADEFTRLEVQVAAILIAVAGVFLKFFEPQVITSSPSTIFIMKLVYAVSVSLLILSLVLGLIHIKRKEKFWDDAMNAKFVSLKKWMECLRGTATFNEAKAYQDGTSLEKGNIIHSPIWTWALQTVFLGLAFILFFVLFIVFLFK